MTLYDGAACVVFFKTREAWGGLSNMASWFPLRVGAVTTPSSEALYQACRFPAYPDLQRVILAEKNPMKAKMLSKPHRAEKTRPDWEAAGPSSLGVRVEVMRWALRVKLHCHPESFGSILLATGLGDIVEKSRRDPFWGAIDRGDGTLEGENVLGRLLMELREELRGHGPPARVEPPPVPGFLLLGEPVGPIGV